MSVELNTLTGNMQQDYTMGQTRDGHYVSRDVYERAVSYFRCGVISREQVLEFMKIKQEFLKKAEELIGKTTNYARKNKLNTMQVIKTLRKEENEYAIKKFKKVSDVLELDETIETFKYLLSKHPEIDKQPTIIELQEESRAEVTPNVYLYEGVLLLKERLIYQWVY